MPSVFTLEGRKKNKKQRKTLGEGDNCRCIYNPRTKQSRLLCYVGKKPGEKGTGYKFQKGGC